MLALHQPRSDGGGIVSGFDWFLVGWWTYCTFVTVALVGKPRKPTEPLTAAIVMLIQAALIVGLLVSRGAL